jgi:hypothetical protein
MVKNYIILVFLILFPLQGQDDNVTKDFCGSLIVKKARDLGFRSLGFSEKIQYHLDLRKCENKDLVKAIKKEVNENQFISDSEKAKSFTGMTSSCAYCIIIFIAYLSIN